MEGFVVLVLAVLLGLIPASIAQSKGRSFVGWWLYGAAIFIIALPHSLLLRRPESSEAAPPKVRTAPTRNKPVPRPVRPAERKHPGTADPAPRVFISHSSKDRDTADTICNALENRGIECWFASRDVDPGENFQQSIHQAIRSAKVMVLVFTGNANTSPEIHKEIALAGKYELIVIPVRVEDVVPNDALAYELATRQWIDLFDDWERQMERLSSRIAAIASIELMPARGRKGADAKVDHVMSPETTAIRAPDLDYPKAPPKLN